MAEGRDKGKNEAYRTKRAKNKWAKDKKANFFLLHLVRESS